MPELKTVTLSNGKTAVISYLDDEFRPVEYDMATVMHILVEGGDSIWAEPQPLETLGEVVG